MESSQSSRQRGKRKAKDQWQHRVTPPSTRNSPAVLRGTDQNRLHPQTAPLSFAPGARAFDPTKNARGIYEDVTRDLPDVTDDALPARFSSNVLFFSSACTSCGPNDQDKGRWCFTVAQRAWAAGVIMHGMRRLFETPPSRLEFRRIRAR